MAKVKKSTFNSSLKRTRVVTENSTLEQKVKMGENIVVGGNVNINLEVPDTFGDSNFRITKGSGMTGEISSSCTADDGNFVGLFLAKSSGGVVSVTPIGSGIRQFSFENASAAGSYYDFISDNNDWYSYGVVSNTSVSEEQYYFPAVPSIGDRDADGLNDSQEAAQGSNPNNPDSDGDLVPDGREVVDGTNPNNSGDYNAGSRQPVNNRLDSDGDGIADTTEQSLGTNPNNSDSDGDTYSDYDEVAAGSDPLDPNDVPPSDVIPPLAPVISSITNDTGASSSDGITNDTTLLFNGTAEADSTVEVFIGGSSIGTTTATGGSWTFDHTGTTLSEGTYLITATATDAANNTSPISSTFTVVVDTTGPVFGSLPSGLSVVEGTATGSVDSYLLTNKPTATDAVDGDVSSNITQTNNYTTGLLSGSTFNVTYSVSDAAGNVTSTSPISVDVDCGFTAGTYDYDTGSYTGGFSNVRTNSPEFDLTCLSVGETVYTLATREIISDWRGVWGVGYTDDDITTGPSRPNYNLVKYAVNYFISGPNYIAQARYSSADGASPPTTVVTYTTAGDYPNYPAQGFIPAPDGTILAIAITKDSESTGTATLESVVDNGGGSYTFTTEFTFPQSVDMTKTLVMRAALTNTGTNITDVKYVIE